jgi:hypothetical protein
MLRRIQCLIITQNALFRYPLPDTSGVSLFILVVIIQQKSAGQNPPARSIFRLMKTESFACIMEQDYNEMD